MSPYCPFPHFASADPRGKPAPRGPLARRPHSPRPHNTSPSPRRPWLDRWRRRPQRSLPPPPSWLRTRQHEELTRLRGGSAISHLSRLLLSATVTGSAHHSTPVLHTRASTRASDSTRRQQRRGWLRSPVRRRRRLRPSPSPSSSFASVSPPRSILASPRLSLCTRVCELVLRSPARNELDTCTCFSFAPTALGYVMFEHQCSDSSPGCPKIGRACEFSPKSCRDTLAV